MIVSRQLFDTRQLMGAFSALVLILLTGVAAQASAVDELADSPGPAAIYQSLPQNEKDLVNLTMRGIREELEPELQTCFLSSSSTEIAGFTKVLLGPISMRTN